MPRDLSDLAVGERWAYRQKQTDPVTCVEVVRLGTTKPARVQIKFVDDAFEGRQEWVPPARLKVPWAGVDAWQRRQSQWSAVYSASELSEREEDAWHMVFDNLRGVSLVKELDYHASGVLSISNLDVLVTDLELDRNAVIDDNLAFIDEEGHWGLPWRLSETIMRRIAEKHADILLAELDADEQRDQRESRYGYQSGKYWISPEICAETRQRWVPVRDLVRQWCGAEARDRHDELIALRAEVLRLGTLIDRAITALRRAKSADADAIEKELGIPLETLRQARQQETPG